VADDPDHWKSLNHRVQAEYIREIVEEVNQRFPGIAFQGPAHILTMYEIDEQTTSITLHEQGNAEEDLIIFRTPYATEVGEAEIEVQIADPRSKEIIIEHLVSNLRKWIAHNRRLAKQMLDRFDLWEEAINS